jgi:murein DD-endopeptidase MepM/ murein hydrolase activator NlpD
MEGDRMRNKKATAFFTRKSYIIAAVIMVVAAFGMIGLYYSQQDKKQEEQLAKEQEELVQQAKAEDQARENALKEKAEAAAQLAKKEKAKAEKEKEKKKKEEEEKAEETEAVSGIIAPKEDNFMDEPAVISNAVQAAPTPEPEFHFNAATDLIWPLQGNVILNYSMDQTVYFATLDQYKYNPAVIIQAEVNSPVQAVASGKVTAVETNEETGSTITVDMGDGYSARYGQLKEIPKNQGDYVENGEVLGYINEPTKYYSVEGANLYFQLLKDGAPVNPMEYLE